MLRQRWVAGNKGIVDDVGPFFGGARLIQFFRGSGVHLAPCALERAKLCLGAVVEDLLQVHKLGFGEAR